MDNITRTDFLDFELCLETGTVKPWRKPDNDPKYINILSSHPQTTIKSLPKMIETRLSSLSSSAKEFEEVKGPYVQALKDAGYKNQDLMYTVPEQKNSRSRKRKIIWFNPPYSAQVSTNLTRVFNGLVKKHFRPNTLLGKLFNKNNLKLSYSTTANLGQIISGHNKKITNKTKTTTQVKGCNCNGGINKCPVNGQCLATDSIYEATVKAETKDDKKYIGLTAPPFKIRHGNHKSDFKIRSRRTATKLAGYIWDLKDEGINTPEVKFEIKEHAPSYNPNAERCLLCLTEKLRIMQASKTLYLNDRSEIFNKCRHRNKFLLSNIK